LPDRESFPVFLDIGMEIILVGMKKIKTKRKGKVSVVLPHGYLRRLYKLWISSWIKNQNYQGLKGTMEKMLDQLKDMETSIKSMAGELARKSKRGD
jgi:hypothetical protein